MFIVTFVVLFLITKRSVTVQYSYSYSYLATENSQIFVFGQIL